MAENTNEQGEPKPIDKDSREKLAKILGQMGAVEQGQRASAAARAAELFQRRPDLAQEIAANLPRLTGGAGQPSYDELARTLNDALDANAAYAAQNAAIREENDRLRHPGVKERIANAMRRLTDIFMPAASAEEDLRRAEMSRKGALRCFFVSSAAGLGGGAALMMGASYEAALGFAGAGWFGTLFYSTIIGDHIEDPEGPVHNAIASAGMGTVMSLVLSSMLPFVLEKSLHSQIIGGNSLAATLTMAVLYSGGLAISILDAARAEAEVQKTTGLGRRSSPLAGVKLRETFAATLAGAVLSSAVVWGTMLAKAHDEKPADPAPQGSAVERQIPAAPARGLIDTGEEYSTRPAP